MPMIKDISSAVSKAGNTIVLVGMTACGGSTIGLYKLSQYWDPAEIVAMGGAVVAISACGMYAIVQINRRIKNAMSITEFLAMVRDYFSSAPDNTEPFDWLTATIETYHGKRRKMSLPCGIDENGNFVEIPMERQDAHLFISGMTGSGKSVLVNQIMIAAARSGLYQVNLVGRSMKDYSLITGMKNIHTVKFGKDDGNGAYEDELPKVLESAYSEIVSRQQFLESRGKRQLSDVRADQRPQSVLLVIDEFTNAAESIKLNNGNRYVGSLFSNAIRIAQEGRAVGVHLVLIGQRPTAMVPKSLRAQMVNITYRTANAQESFWATGSKTSDAENLIMGDHKTGTMSQISVTGGYINAKAFVPLTTDVMLSQATKDDDSRPASEPFWLHKYQSPTRLPQQPPQRNTLPTEIIESARAFSPVRAKKPAGNGFRDHVKAIANTAKTLYETHPDFQNPPRALSLERTVKIALCSAIGLAQNETMRAVFGGQKGEYRSWVKLVCQHMEQANNVQLAV